MTARSLTHHSLASILAALGAAIGLLSACERVDPTDAGQAVARIDVAPGAATVIVGRRTSYTATVSDARGRVLEGVRLLWRSSDTAVAHVDSTGEVTGRARGAATISASSGRASGSAAVLVVVVASVRISPTGDTLLTGESAQFAATAVDTEGREVPGAHFNWYVDGGEHARVDSSGRVTALAPGRAILNATTADLPGPGLPLYAPIGSALVIVVEPAVYNCATGAVVAGAILDTATWSAAGGPYCASTSVTIARRLTLLPGTSVYIAHGGALQLAPGSTLEAGGSAARPILLAGADTMAMWPGIALENAPVNCPPRQGAQVRLAHVRLAQGNVVLQGGTLEVDSSSIDGQIQLCATSGRVLGSRVGTVALSLAGDFAIEGSLVRGQIICRRTVVLRLRSSRIEGQEGPALFFEEASTVCSLAEAWGVRIVGNRLIGYLPDAAALRLVTEPDAADSLAGNVNDLIELHSVSHFDVSGGLTLPPLGYAGGYIFFEGTGVLRLAAGARLYSAAASFAPGVRVVARGTPSAPVVFTGAPGYTVLDIGGAPGAPALLSNVRVVSATVLASPGRPLLLDSARVVAGGRVELRAGGSRITSSVVDSALVPSDTLAAIVVGDGDTVRATAVRRSMRAAGLSSGGDGIRTLGAAVVDSCEVAGSAGDGIVVTRAAGVQIRHCNLQDNAGAGVRNASSTYVDARYNWWGDPAGPYGPAGDGVIGLVYWSPWLTAPIRLPVVLAGRGARPLP